MCLEEELDKAEFKRTRKTRLGNLSWFLVMSNPKSMEADCIRRAPLITPSVSPRYGTALSSGSY